MKELKVRITLTDEMLGSLPANTEVYSDFIAKNAPDAPTRAEEIEASSVQEVDEKGMTVFLKDEGGHPYIWNYQIKGFFKEAFKMLRNVKDSAASKVTNYLKKIDGLVFVFERKIPLMNPDGTQIDRDRMGVCQRPLRGQTAQGERIALASSETVPAGTWFDCRIKLLDESLEKALREALDYGELKGLLQWRNSGKGCFTWKELKY